MSTAKAGTARPRKRMTAKERREVIERAALQVFAERGYHRASIEEIARSSGVTPPVVYDHFASKLELHRRLLERTRDELLEMWREHLAGDHPAEERIPRAIDAWARYVEEHPYAPRMVFHEATGEPELQALHQEVQAQARAALGAILGREPGAENIAGSAEAEALEMAAEVMRAGLTGLAVWWSEHPEVPRERIVATAVNALWIGFERVRAGESWPEGNGSLGAQRPSRSFDQSLEESESDGKTWNSVEDIARHRAMTPQQRWRRTISLSQAAQRLARAERVDER